MTDTVARLEGISHRYGETAALCDITLDFPAGCMVGLIGPDGVGKSTLLGLIAGARELQQGSLQVLGGDMASHRFRNQAAPRIAYMPQGLGGNLYRSEEHTSELQSRPHLVCRLLLEKKKKKVKRS